MLLSFSVSNHKSIRDEQTLHLQPVYDKSRPALPIAAIFGANAAGKSNILDALSFMVRAVRDSFSSWRGEIPRAPFRLDAESSTAESTFVVELLLDEVRWTYGFTVDATAVREEWLYSYPQHRRRTVFKRNADKISVGSASSLDRSLVKSLSVLLPSTSLFLSLVGATSLPEVASIHGWFTAVNIIPANGAVDSEQAIIRHLEAVPDRSRLVSLLVAADVGIVDVDMQRLLPRSSLTGADRLERTVELSRDLMRAEQQKDVPEQTRLLNDMSDQLEGPFQGELEKRLMFLHGAGRIRMSFDDESNGTKVWLSYLGPVLDALDSGGLLVVDEIDTSLHPHLTVQLVRLFRDTEVNQRGAQLVFTTHDATLLGKNFGEEILGRDEIWFVEKNADQSTELFSLADFKPRQEDNAQRRYLTGSYGAIPQPGELRFDDAVRGRSA